MAELTWVVTAALIAPAFLFSQVATAPEDPIASLTAEDLAAGKLLYERHCAACHAPDGSGGRGAPLAARKLRRAGDSQGLFRVIQKGVPGTEMPRTWQMTDREIWRVAGHVLSLGRTAVVALPGDAARGRALYVATGCAQCHIVRGEGSGLGPELTDIGARRNPAYLREALIEPGKSAPDLFLVVSLRTKDGRAIRGIRLNEDPFTIQVRDNSNQLHSFRKSQLAEFRKLSGQTLMPAYAHLGPGGVDDLVAYLASLRGEP